jgi:5'-methylthioadenosine nucleosidase
MSMDKEGQDFAHKYSFTTTDKKLLIPEIPAKIYEKCLDNDSLITFVLSGICPLHGVNRIGPSIQTLALVSLATFKPDIVINSGFAGGFESKGANIGDIYFAKGTIFNHDRYFTPDDPYKNYCEGGFPVLTPDSILCQKLGAKTGQITSSGSMLASNEDTNNMMRFATIVKDMEASAIAEAAFIMKTPFIALKVITDLVDKQICTQKQFNENFPALTTKLEIASYQTIDFYTM